MNAETSSTLLLSARDPADRPAWFRLVTIYSPLLHAWIRRAGIPPHDADDLVQEVLLALARELPTFSYDRTKGTFRGWLRTILANRIRYSRRASERYGRAATEAGLDLDALADPSSELSRVWDADHDRHVAAGLLEAVRHEFGGKVWRAFMRVVMDGERPAEVAADLGMSVESAYQARSRVLARLRREAAGLLD
jgi:RNA polymerase sigma-70 factor (ECF subfamily)